MTNVSINESPFIQAWAAVAEITVALRGTRAAFYRASPDNSNQMVPDIKLSNATAKHENP